MAQPAPAPMDNMDNEVGTPETSKTLQINADGTWTPATGISINAGGEAKFDVDYPTGMTVCNIAISVTFSASVDDGTGGTVKIGS
jgi:hypothetical protein